MTDKKLIENGGRKGQSFPILKELQAATRANAFAAHLQFFQLHKPTLRKTKRAKFPVLKLGSNN